MKFGIHYIYWQQNLDCKSYVPFVEKAKSCGFDCLELGDNLIVHMDEREVERLAAASKAYEIELTLGLDPGPEMALTSSQREIRRRGVDMYKRLFPKLSRLGISMLCGHLLNAPPTKPSTLHRQEEWERGVEAVAEIAGAARDYGIRLNVEVCNRYESHLLNTAAQGAAFIRETGERNLGLLLDTFHMNIEEAGFTQAIQTAGDLLGHLHIGENNRGLPGVGHLPWREIADALQSIGYKRRLTMEPLVQAGGELGDSCRIWRDLTYASDAAELDAKAAASLQTLKSFFRNDN